MGRPVGVPGAILSSDGAGVALESTEGVRRALHVTGTGSILVLVLGVVVSAGEYRTQTATDTFLTTPKRHRVLGAKIILAAGVGVVFGLVSAAEAFVLSHVLSWRTCSSTSPPRPPSGCPAAPGKP